LEYQQWPLADIVAADPTIAVVDDQRDRLGYVLVVCPNDDGTGDHDLFVCNPKRHLPAHVYCLSDKCSHIDPAVLLRGIGLHVTVQ
jgi:hypothetical protein